MQDDFTNRTQGLPHLFNRGKKEACFRDGLLDMMEGFCNITMNDINAIMGYPAILC